MPKVSVIVPTQNRAGFLRTAIQSVLDQSFADFELIVVDDGSEDQTAEAVRRFSDARLRYIRHDSKKGQGATRNDGIRSASGEYIALLDDDDQWVPDKLKKQVELFDGSPSRLGMVYTGFWQVEASTQRVIRSVTPEHRGQVFQQLCLDNWIGTCSTVMIRRACLEKVGLFDEELPSGVDWDMWLRIAKEFEVDYISEPLVLYNVHENRISTNYDSLIRGLEAINTRYEQFFKRNRKSYSRSYLALGVLYCFQGDTRNGRKRLLKAIRLYPFEMRHYFNMCLSFLGPQSFRKIKEMKEKYSPV